MIQDSGTNTVGGWLRLGATQNSTGFYDMAVDASGVTPTLLFPNYGMDVGFNGTGTFIQERGYVSCPYVVIAFNPNSKGQYQISGGSLNSSAITISDDDNAVGTFAQSGGSSVTTATLTLGGYSSGSSGTYTLSSGTLNSSREDVGTIGTGAFTQTGGLNNLTDALSVAVTPTSKGTYSLGGGTLNVSGQANVGVSGVGTVTQTAGSASAQFLSLGANSGGAGFYFLSGGSLSVGSAAIGDAGSGYALVNNAAAKFAATGSIVIGRAGTGSGGFMHTAGTLSATELVAGAGGIGQYWLSNTAHLVTTGAQVYGGNLDTGSVGIGTMVQGGGTSSAGGWLILGATATSKGVYVMSGASTGTFGGILVGDYGIGSFVQNGGTVYSPFVVPAYNPNSTGQYQMSGGALNTSALTVSDDSNAAGTFTQDGGTVVASNVIVADYSPNSIGTYSLSTGTLSTSREVIGSIGHGSFTQTGGLNNATATITIGGASGSTGYYSLSGGTLGAGTLIVGDAGNGSFTQSVGTNHVTGYLFVGNGTASSGAYSLSGGTLAVDGNEIIGNQGNASFVQTGGMNSAGIELDLLYKPATYTISGGTLSAYVVSMDGTAGASGTFTQSGGAVNTAFMSINKGTYLQTGGTLTTGTFYFHGSSPSQYQLQGGTLRLTSDRLDVGSTGLLGAAPQIDGDCWVDQTNQNTIVEAGGIVHMTGGTLTSTVGHTILDGGTLSMENSASFVGGGTLSNTGVVHGTGQISSALQNSFSGLVSVQSTDHLKFTAASNSNDGVIQLSGGTVEFTGALSNQATGRVIFARGTMQTSTLQNTGSIIISGGNADLLGALNNNATALVQVGNRSIGTFHDTVVNQPGSVFNIFFASSAVFTGDVSGLSAFIGGGAKTFQGIAAGGSLISTGSSVVESTGSLTVYSIRESALTVRGAAKVLPNGTASAFSRLSVLTIDGGALDLCDNHLILDSTDIASVKSYINSAYNAGSWNGNGLGSSSAQAQRTSLHHTALGYATASSLGVGTFDGQPVNGLSVLVRYAYSGDANLDGVVNALDFNALASSFGGASNRFWYQGDFNYDGMTNTLDFNALAINFNAALPGSPLGSLVPEPATSSACAIALIGTRRWRRRCAR